MIRPRLPQLLDSIRRWQNTGAVLLAIMIGLSGGAGAIVFRYLIQSADRLFFTEVPRVLPLVDQAYVIVFPAVGLVLVSAMIRRWAPEAQGHGVPEVMYALKKRSARIRPRVVIVKAVASALCIGSGGSVGREGPIVQIGCAVGSSFGQLLGLSVQRTRLLVACGAAAGIGGTFNAPIGGVIFAMEVILGSFAARSFGLVVIASVTSTALCQAVLGTEPAFRLAEIFSLKSPLELPVYLGLGLVTAAVSLTYVKAVYSLEYAFMRWRWPPAIKACLGGLAVGAIGYVGIRYLGGRYLFGVGYDGIEAALGLKAQVTPDWSVAGSMTISVLLLLIVLKMLATSLTLAAGGSGGVFAPALFIGAMTGGAFGSAANLLFANITAPPGAYALVGMGAVFAGAAHAPMTAILILFEMTGDYKIILPLMMAAVISYLVVSAMGTDSIYTAKLRRLGGLAPSKMEPSVLDLVVVADAMSRDFKTVAPTASVHELAARFQQDQNRSFGVVDERERLVGIVTEHDVEGQLMQGDSEHKTAGQIMTRAVITCTPEQRLRDVLTTLCDQNVGQVPVVDSSDPSRLLGVLRRREILWAYGELATEQQRLLRQNSSKPTVDERSLAQFELEVQADNNQLCSKRVRDIALPDQCLVVVLQRQDRTVVPGPGTVVKPGDVLTVVTTRARESLLRRWVQDMTRSANSAEVARH